MGKVEGRKIRKERKIKVKKTSSKEFFLFHMLLQTDFTLTLPYED